MKNLFSKFKKNSEKMFEDTYLVIGLGNPGDEYKDSRHNIGFLVIDHLVKKLNVNYASVKNQAVVYKTKFEGNVLYLMKPQTFMNHSGQSVRPMIKEFNIPHENVIVIYDDADLPFETLRLRPEGSSSGQKGMQSIIEKLGTQKIARMRVGIDRPPGKMRTPNYVLKKFSKAQKEFLPFVLDRASDAVICFLKMGIEKAMNDHNRSE
jgi:PTH1 family peptidyl-tRNA hydrolase